MPRATSAGEAIRIANKRFVSECAVSLLIEHPQNPNVGAVDVIGKSLVAHGFVGVVIAQEAQHEGKHFILAGNHRYRALVAAGATTIPVIFVDFDDVEALQFLLVDNKAAEEGHRDEGQLLDVLRYLESMDALEPSGYVDEELEDLTERLGQGNSFEDLEPTGETLDYTQVELSIRMPRERVTPELEASVKELAMAVGGRYIVKGSRTDANTPNQ